MASAWPVRFECLPGSGLPQTLRDMGLEVQSLGTGERLLPVAEIMRQHGRTERTTREQVAPATVEEYGLNLPMIER